MEPASEEMSLVSTLTVYNEIAQIIMPNSMVPDPGWFDSNQIKFEDQQRGIQLFLKSNKVIVIDNKINTVLV